MFIFWCMLLEATQNYLDLNTWTSEISFDYNSNETLLNYLLAGFSEAIVSFFDRNHW